MLYDNEIYNLKNKKINVYKTQNVIKNLWAFICF